MASILDDLRYRFRSGSMVTQLILVNVAVFLLLTLVRISGFLFKDDFLSTLIPWISGSNDWQKMLYRPWTLLTYMFVHVDIFHIFFNLLLLYVAGQIFENLLNGKRLLAVYFYGGIAGFLLYFVSFNIFPVFAGTSSIIYGASASIMAVLVAIATYTPNLELRLLLIGNVKLKYVAIFFVAIDILFLDGGNTGGRLAHLGGAILGFLYSTNLKNGRDWSKFFYAITGFFGNLFRPRPKMKVASRNPGYQTQYYHQSSKSKKDKEMKIDEILDKISRSGYDSLTREEKEFLFNSSKQ